ncbi:MAG: peptidoglycan-associated lipoprotein Pal [Deltaproteobacteria bacterium]|nr:peptidoglycan-associated lipoprotein Pal [Deltaproteobacteria bacterium]
MAYRLSAVLSGLMFFSFLVLNGCAPPATTKPEVSSPSKPTLARESDGGKPSKVPAGESKTPSSLEALRRGEAPTGGPLKEIYFDFDKYDLRPDARTTLRANADWLKGNPSAQVEVEGHADERGTNEYNLALGAKRAQAAKDYLVTLGVSARRLSTKSYGEEVPVCREKTEECWKRNRRDRFVVKAGKPGL